MFNEIIETIVFTIVEIINTIVDAFIDIANAIIEILENLFR